MNRLGRSALGAAILLAGCARTAVPPRLDPVPGKRAVAQHGMVAASHPDAAAAGVEMLRRGGNAVDAAVATAFALSVVEPSQTGLGGGGSATLWLRRDRRAASVDFMAASGGDSAWSSTAPPSGGRQSGRAAAVPGTVAGLLHLLERYGTLPREVVIAPALRLAREGFVVSPLLSRTTASSAEKLRADPEAAARFLPGGAALQAGDRLVQPELAATLERVARGGASAFYTGDAAARVSAKIQAAGGLVTAADLAAYRVIDRRPLCGRVLGQTVLTAPPPLSGMTVVEALGVFERAVASRPRGASLAESPQDALALADALRIADADRARWRGDPDAMPVPARGIATAAFAAERAALVGAAGDTVPAGDPWAEDAAAPPRECAAIDPFPAAPAPAATTGDESRGADAESLTSHLAVVDADRNAVSMTFTVGVLFGSGVYADGFFLNSSAANFDARTAAPNRRNNSTMSPTILLDGDDVRLVVGAAGSQYIPPAVVQTVLQVSRYGRDLGDALAAPRLNPLRARAVEIEPGWSPAVYAALRAAGFDTRSRVADLMFGGVHAIEVRRDGRLVGAADPRRDGAAVGY